jgi:hypothetical protein
MVRMTTPRDDSLHLAVHCDHLLQPASRNTPEPQMLCGHPAREGRACVGPFLHDLATDCGLWEPHPDRHLIAMPVPDRWQGRRRRSGFDMQRGW